MSDNLEKTLQHFLDESIEADAKARALKQEAAEAEKYSAECKGHIKNLLEENQLAKASTKYHHIYLRKKRDRVVYEQLELLPAEVVQEVMVRKPDETAIRRMIKGGIHIQGASLEDGGHTILIKAKGESAWMPPRRSSERFGAAFDHEGNSVDEVA